MNGGYYAASPDPSFLITGVPSPPEVIGGSYTDNTKLPLVDPTVSVPSRGD